MGAAPLPLKGRKGGSSKPKAPKEAPDSLQSVATAKILIAVGEGEFDEAPTAQNIYLDNTPLANADGSLNFEGVVWDWRPGSIDQTYIPGIPSIENETTINVELSSSTAWVRSVSNTQLCAVRIRFAWPALQSQDSSGNVNGYSIQYAVDVATDGGAYVEVLSESVSGKTTSRYERSRRIDLPAAESGWQIRVRRLTPNQNSNRVADTMLIAGFTEVIDAKLSYPNTALLYVEFSAEQFQNIPAVTVECRARRVPVPSNYDPLARTYTGIWDGTMKSAWTDNPVWHTYDLVISDRFGLGRRIKAWMVDRWEMYRIAQYCDQLVPDGKGGQEPRHTCNLNLQSRARAWNLLRDMTAIYRGMTYWAKGQLNVQADIPRATDFDFAFTRANVIDGKFGYASASERTRYSRALVSYDNPANNYDTDVAVATDKRLQLRYGDNPVEISAIGCTRESEAQRRGKWAILTNSQDRTVTFRVGLDGRIPLPGYVIPVADSLLAGRDIGGRISAVAGNTLTLDRDTQAKPGDRLIVNLPSGKCEGRTVQSVAGRAVTVTTAFSETPRQQLVWALDADDLAVPLYRVMKMSRPENGIFEITALQYEPSKFAAIDTGARLETRPVSVLPTGVIGPPASVGLSTYSTVEQGIAVTSMTISWPAVSGAVAYDVEWRRGDGNWVRLPRVGALSVDVPGIYAGVYLARVRAVSAFEISSIWRTSDQRILEGKTTPPPAVASLTASPLVFGIQLDWGFPAEDAEDTQRTEIQYNTSPAEAGALHLGDYAYPTNRHTLTGLAAAVTLHFRARLVDRTGNIGPWSSWVMGQSSADPAVILDYVAGQIGETELAQQLAERIDLIDGAGPGSVNARVAAEATARLAAIESEAAARQAAIDTAAAELTGQIDALSAQVGDIMQADEWVQQNAYPLGDLVKSAGKLYRARQAVPAGVALADAAYWQFIGNYSSLGDAVGATISRVNVHDQQIGELDGQVTSVANDLSALTVDVAGKAAATALTAVEQRVTTAEGSITSQGSAITALQNAVRDGEFDAFKTWQFDNSVEGWSAQGATLVASGGILTYTTTASDAQMICAGLSINGARYPILRIKIARTSGTDAAFQLFYANSAHGYREVSSKAASIPGPNGAYSVIELDMSGVDDWATSTITAIRLDIGQVNNANYAIDWIAIGRKAPAASSAAMSSLESRVSTAEGTVTSQGSALTSLQNSLSATNSNVSAAQAAADSAAALAGSKGKVLVQTATPAAADQLAQNLWIDINGGANTPKRWNGSAWVAVTDKVATDAAAAAANALSVANTKADASALTSLSSTVTQQGNTLSSQGSSITSLQNSLSTTNSNVSAAQAAADSAAALAGSKGKVLVQTATPAAADQLAQNLWIDINGGANTPKRWNGSAWVAVTDKVATDAAAAAANALSVANTKADASALTSLSNTVTQQGNTLSAQGGSITQLQAEVSGSSIDPALLWQFDSGVEGWAASGATLSASNGVLSVAGTGTDPQLISPAISLAGAKFTKVRAKITRTAGGSWDGTLYYFTASHGWSGSYRKVIPNPSLAVGQSAVLEWSMDQLTAGGTDWVDNTITRLRFDFGTGASDSFDVDWIAVGRIAPAAGSSALSALESRVSTAEGTVTSQGSALTSLQNSLSTTNSNVTAAQAAADAANALAGSKGKVLVQTATPAAADQLAQNLWIDINGGANTPKRWNGSSWVAVTDKVATDAAAAAANALSVANTKADASALTSLSSTVTQQGNTLTSQGNSITTLNNQIKSIGGDNLLPNSSFEEAAGSSGRAKCWAAGGAGSISLVASARPLSSKAQRLENAALAAGSY